MKRVLITGASGFIGRHCLPLLVARGYEVHAVSLGPPPKGLSATRWYEVDLLDPEQPASLVAEVRPSHLLHLAWYTTPGKYWTSLENLRWVQASLRLLHGFATQGGHRIVMAGTCAEYDWRYGYCSETVTPLVPATLYGACKHSLQLMSTAYAAQMGLSAAWGRVFFTYGPHEYPDRLVPTVIRAVLENEPAMCSNSAQIRDFLYVQDVADAFVMLLECDVSGAVNIASGQPIALREVIYKIAENRNRASLVQLGARPSPPREPAVLFANVDRLKNEVGWCQTHDLDAGLERTLRWWEEHLGAAVSGRV